MNANSQRLMDQAGLGIQHDGIILTKSTTGAKALEDLIRLVAEECARIAELKEQGYKAYLPDTSVGHYIRENFGIV